MKLTSESAAVQAALTAAAPEPAGACIPAPHRQVPAGSPIAEDLGHGVSLYAGDCRSVLPTLAANSIDACVTDPPYGLKFMARDWDHGVPGVRYWREVHRVLKPGAYLVAFGGTRTYHRMVCAIEDAGFEIRDCIMWVYGSGFPKSLDVSKQLDRMEGAKRKIIGFTRASMNARARPSNKE